MSIEDFSKMRPSLQGKKIILTGGVFDMFHAGHLHYLQTARALGDILVVHIDGDRLTASRKGEGRPIVSEVERTQILQGLACVDYVLCTDSVYYDELLLDTIKPSIIARSARPGAERAADVNGVPVVNIDEYPSVHTTSRLSELNSPARRRYMRLAERESRLGYSKSGTKVGACVVMANGDYFTGHNVGNASPAVTMCAERMALYIALNSGRSDFTELYIYSPSSNVVTPCGLCRQVISEFFHGHDLTIHMSNGTFYKPSSIESLLPFPFTSPRSEK